MSLGTPSTLFLVPSVIVLTNEGKCKAISLIPYFIFFCVEPLMASNDENDTSGERAAEDSNSSELLPGSLPVDIVEMVLILRLQTILQVENMAVVNKLGEPYLLNLELELGPCHTKIVGKNLSDVSCMQC